MITASELTALRAAKAELDLLKKSESSQQIQVIQDIPTAVAGTSKPSIDEQTELNTAFNKWYSSYGAVALGKQPEEVVAAAVPAAVGAGVVRVADPEVTAVHELEDEEGDLADLGLHVFLIVVLALVVSLCGAALLSVFIATFPEMLAAMSLVFFFLPLAGVLIHLFITLTGRLSRRI